MCNDHSEICRDLSSCFKNTVGPYKMCKAHPRNVRWPSPVRRMLTDLRCPLSTQGKLWQAITAMDSILTCGHSCSVQYYDLNNWGVTKFNSNLLKPWGSWGSVWVKIIYIELFKENLCKSSIVLSFEIFQENSCKSWIVLSFKFFQENSCKSWIVLWIEFEKTMEQFTVEHKNTLLGLRSFKSKDTKLQIQGLQKKKRKTLRSEPSSS
jgi:hypothetical protein